MTEVKFSKILMIIILMHPCFIKAETLNYYDENNLLIKTVNGDVVNTYTRDENGLVTLREYYKGEENIANNIPSYYYLYNYDENGNVLKYTQYNSSNDSYRLEYVHEFDENGRMITNTAYNRNHVVAYRQEYTYDENGRKLSMTRYNGEDNVLSEHPIAAEQTKYVYDNNGRLVKTIYYEGEDNILNQMPTSETLYAYDYDRYGNVTAEYQNGILMNSYIYHPDYLKKQWEKNHKRIYTVEEAERVSKPTGNTFKLRYK